MSDAAAMVASAPAAMTRSAVPISINWNSAGGIPQLIKSINSPGLLSASAEGGGGGRMP